MGVWIGLHRLLEKGRFTHCDETFKNLRDYRRLNNPVLCFVDDECDQGETEEHVCDKALLYAKYVSYCKVNGYIAFGCESFFRELYTAISSLKTSRPRGANDTRVRIVSGLRLIAPPAPGAE